MTDWLTPTLLLTGSGFIFIAGLGILRFPTTLSQAHPLSKVVTLGINLILIATAYSLGGFLTSLKIACIILFHFITIPLAGHIFARYAAKYEEKSLTSPASKDH